MPKIRVLVVEDSLTVRAHLVEVLRSDPDIEVVGEAGDGRQAIELCRRLRPSVITLDMMLPVMSGLDATEHIMAHFPTPILVVSASTNRGELFKTYEALAAGALDVMDKPRGEASNEEWRKRFLETVKLVSRIAVITHPRGRLRALERRPAGMETGVPAADHGEYGIVALGASTGGPAAIVEILRALPPQYELPVLLVLHIGQPFGQAFAEWLDGQTAHRVSFAQEGDPVGSLPHRLVLAPPDRHLVVRNGRLRLDTGPARHSCRPSVDMLFESVAHEFGPRAVACLLTGMGRDGADGLLAVRRAGGLTIAQDEATSVVYGMPREAALLGAAARVLPLGDIGPALAALGGAKGTAWRAPTP